MKYRRVSYRILVLGSAVVALLLFYDKVSKPPWLCKPVSEIKRVEIMEQWREPGDTPEEDKWRRHDYQLPGDKAADVYNILYRAKPLPETKLGAWGKMTVYYKDRTTLEIVLCNDRSIIIDHAPYEVSHARYEIDMDKLREVVGARPLPQYQE
ncbi:MAG: hypothetical protein IT445_15615 [Phycisphaeraceae bacterium]|nr:hypothetical protein [Phycisphaeraceae bacterium]